MFKKTDSGREPGGEKSARRKQNRNFCPIINDGKIFFAEGFFRQGAYRRLVL